MKGFLIPYRLMSFVSTRPQSAVEDLIRSSLKARGFSSRLAGNEKEGRFLVMRRQLFIVNSIAAVAWIDLEPSSDNGTRVNMRIGWHPLMLSLFLFCYLSLVVFIPSSILAPSVRLILHFAPLLILFLSFFLEGFFLRKEIENIFR